MNKYAFPAWLWPVVFGLLLSACGSLPTQAPAPVDADPVSAAEPDPAPTDSITEPAHSMALDDPAAAEAESDIQIGVPFRSKPAVLALINNARAAQQSGDLGAAHNDLQRAQRIAPEDPSVYLELANVQYQMEDYAQAEQLALKGVSVAGQDRDIQRQLWQLLSQIKMAQGDFAGAREAEQRAAGY